MNSNEIGKEKSDHLKAKDPSHTKEFLKNT